MTKLLVVIGLTGEQGGSVAEVYLKEAGWKVRGITRNPDKAQAWSDRGIEVVKGDLDDKESLAAAFKGAHAIFSITDFWAPFFDPGTQLKLKCNQTINEYCYENELQQGKNIADAAASVNNLERLVVSALCDASKWSKGRYTWVYHFDSKAHIVEYVHKTHPIMASKMSVIQVGSYMSNWKQPMSLSRPVKQADGTYRLAIIGSGKGLIPQFGTRTDCGYVARAAIQLPPGKNILAAGSMISWTDYLKVWCDVNNVSFGGCDEIPLSDFIATLPLPALARELGEMMAFMDEFGYDGGDPSVVQAANLGVSCPLTTWEEYIKTENWSSVLNMEPIVKH